ncbi:MAG TPA: hypothetical protein VH087_13470 [Thermoanaerobaculia bacterium]|nr:hypothetical protein [Thermoanaerobaculia bacterium]
MNAAPPRAILGLGQKIHRIRMVAKVLSFVVRDQLGRTWLKVESLDVNAAGTRVGAEIDEQRDFVDVRRHGDHREVDAHAYSDERPDPAQHGVERRSPANRLVRRPPSRRRSTP